MVVKWVRQQSIFDKNTKKFYNKVDPCNLILGLWSATTFYVVIHIVFKLKFPFMG